MEQTLFGDSQEPGPAILLKLTVMAAVFLGYFTLI